MVNDAFNNKVKGKDGLIPKDHKDVITVICKLRNDLHLLAEYRLKPLPAIYKQGRKNSSICLIKFSITGSLGGCVGLGADGYFRQPKHYSSQRC